MARDFERCCAGFDRGTDVSEVDASVLKVHTI